MSKIFLSMSMSLDGFIATEGRTRETPMGVGGLRLHSWLFDQKTDVDDEVAANLFTTAGAVILGWRTYIDAIHDAWGGANPFNMPAFVLCKEIPSAEDQIEDFTFVTEGIEAALEKARLAAGEKDIWVQGGASVAQQYLKSGLLDELRIHLAPVLLTKGLRLFENIGENKIELEAAGATQTPGATHLVFRVIK